MKLRFKCTVPVWLAFVALLVLSLASEAQGNPAANAAVAPTVTFTLDWEQAKPPHYSITVSSSGHASYASQDQPSQPAADAADPPYTLEFQMIPANRDRISALAAQCNYFHGSFDFVHHKVAQTGKKTLAFSDSSRHFETSYNWSENNAIEELTTLFQSISNTVEAGRQLQLLERFDKLGLSRELAAMEQLADEHHLAEIDLIAPELRAIAANPAYMRLAQQRAQNLLRLAAPAAGPSPAASARN